MYILFVTLYYQATTTDYRLILSVIFYHHATLVELKQVLFQHMFTEAFKHQQQYLISVFLVMIDLPAYGDTSKNYLFNSLIFKM
jgi:hypothetical protein